MSETQKAILITEIGKPATIVNNRPIPTPGPNEVLLKVTIAGINPHDAKARDDGLFIANDLPAIVTNDVVGVITKLGKNVTGVQIGDRIVSHAGFAPGSTQNGLQEYAIAEVGAFAKIPESITDDEAATLPTNIIAPLVALFVTLEIPAPWSPEASKFDYANTAILIIGGGTNCGRFGVQLAKIAGIGKILVIGGNKAELETFGATHVIDRHGSDDTIIAKVRDIVGDELVYAYDTINPPETQILALNALSNTKKGALARLLPLGPVDESKVIGKTAGFEVRNVFGSSQAQPVLAKGFWERVPAYLEEGKLKPLAYSVKNGLTADNVNTVLDAYTKGERVIKTHIHI